MGRGLFRKDREKQKKIYIHTQGEKEINILLSVQD